MKDIDSARELARTMVDLGTDAGLPTTALLTDMSTPMGLSAGNGLEVAESLEVLAGGGPSDVVELTLALAREMLTAAGMPDADPAEQLAGGQAMDPWRAVMRAQDGAPEGPRPPARRTGQARGPAEGER